MSSVVMTGRRMKRSVFIRRFPSPAAAGLTSTCAPGASRSWPSVTTRSPAAAARS